MTTRWNDPELQAAQERGDALFPRPSGYTDLHRPYTGRRWRFQDYTGTVCSEPFTLTLPLANGDGNLTGEVTHGCVAVNLDQDFRYFHRDESTGCTMWVGTVIGHVDDVE